MKKFEVGRMSTFADEILAMYLLNMSKAEEDWFSHCVEMRGFDRAVEELRKERAQGSTRHERAVEYLKLEDMRALRDHAVSTSKNEVDKIMIDIMTALAASAAKGYDGADLSFSHRASEEQENVIRINIPREDPIHEFNVAVEALNKALRVLKEKGFMVDPVYQEDDVFAYVRVEW